MLTAGHPGPAELWEGCAGTHLRLMSWPGLSHREAEAMELPCFGTWMVPVSRRDVLCACKGHGAVTAG